MFEKLMDSATPRVTFGKEELSQAIKESNLSNAVAILYSHTGEKFLAIGEKSYNLSEKRPVFMVQEIRCSYGRVKKDINVDALAITSQFMGVKVLISRGSVCNEVNTSLSLFTNNAIVSLVTGQAV